MTEPLFWRALEEQLRTLDFYASEKATPVFDKAFGADERRQLLGTLSCAEPFYIGRNVCQLVAQEASEMPEWFLMKELLPAPTGFAWLERPVELPVLKWDSTEEYNLPLSAMAWHLRTDEQLNGIETIWLHTHPERPLLVPWTYFPWRFGSSWNDVLNEVDEHGQLGSKARAEAKVRFLGCLLAFMAQRIVRVVPLRSPRACRRRLAQRPEDLSEILIQTVTLRRIEQRKGYETESAAAEVDWSCQWVVRGHWRQQWYPSIQRHQALFIAPYVKGPEDKPLRSSRGRVFAVVR